MLEDEKDQAEWARLVCRNFLDCIEAVKRRQWAATNYILLLFAAVIGYAKLYTQKGINGADIKFDFSWLLIAVFVISIIGIYHLLDMQLVMARYRLIILKNIAKKYPYLLEIGMLEDDSNFFKYFSITVFFIALVLGGLTLVVLFLYKSPENNLLGFSLCCCIAVFLFVDIIFAIALTLINLDRSKMFNEELDKKNIIEREGTR